MLLAVSLQGATRGLTHQFHYLTGQHKTFNVTVIAKFLTHAKIKCTKL